MEAHADGASGRYDRRPGDSDTQLTDAVLEGEHRRQDSVIERAHLLLEPVDSSGTEGIDPGDDRGHGRDDAGAKLGPQIGARARERRGDASGIELGSREHLIEEAM